jgi:hypothetical protein
MKLFKRKPKPQPRPERPSRHRFPVIMLLDAAKALSGVGLCDAILIAVDDKHISSDNLRALAQKLDRKADELEREQARKVY